MQQNRHRWRGTPVLIAPLWNWNTIDEYNLKTLLACSNRTFMELKCWLDLPLCLCLHCSNRTFMELKCWLDLPLCLCLHVLIAPLWNWNTWCGKTQARRFRSNRTFMELKSARQGADCRRCRCSNRTFMELKSRCSLRPFLAWVF